MDITERLWLLKQIYHGENRYFDTEENRYRHRIPARISAAMQAELAEAGRMPDRMYKPEHAALLDELYRLAGTWTLREAADAFLAGLWSAPLLWRCALPAKLISLVMPPHPHTPYGGSKDTCIICGFREQAVDITGRWYGFMTGAMPLDGDPVGYVLALREMEQAGRRPVPTEYDIWTFRAILTVIRCAPPGARYAKIRDALHREKLLPVSDRFVYGSLLESLALIGLLDTDDYPGMASRYTTYGKRDERPSVRVEVQAPLAWWNSSVGVNSAALQKIFPDRDCSSVDLTNRPAPVPPPEQTIAGSLARRRLPRTVIPKSPDAGSGPAAAGDVYGVRIRDDVWITVYCHRVKDGRVLVEYLDGVFPEMPVKAQLRNTVRPRGSGRWQADVTALDKTTGIRRIARDVPPPAAGAPGPERIPFVNAKELKRLAWWCFPDLD